MSDREPIYIEVPQEQKEKWENWIEKDPNAANLTHLIKLSVQEHIHREQHDESQSQELLTELTSEVEEARREVVREIEDTRDRIDGVEAAVEEAKSTDLQKAVYGIIPRFPSGTDRDEIESRLEGMQGAPAWERIGWTGRVDELAQWFNVSQNRMLTILKQLAERDTVRTVKPANDNNLNNIHYFRIIEQ